MLYAKIIDGAVNQYPYSQTDLVRDNKGTSFPNALMSVASLAEWGVFPVLYSQVPDYDPSIEKLIELTPISVDGSWVQQWSVVPLTPEEVNARNLAEWEVVRDQRNAKLLESDWTQLPDAPLTEAKKIAWQTYRQALRDVTTQADPFAIVWPEQPE